MVDQVPEEADAQLQAARAVAAPGGQLLALPLKRSNRAAAWDWLYGQNVLASLEPSAGLTFFVLPWLADMLFDYAHPGFRRPWLDLLCHKSIPFWTPYK